MADATKEKESDDGFVQRLLNSILTTLQVRVKNVHVRYEDSGMGTPEQQNALNSLAHCPSFCVGIVLDSLEGLSTDSSWNPSETSTSIVELLLHKLVRLTSLSVYLDIGDRSILKACGVNDPSSRENPDFKAFTSMMSDTASRRCDLQPHHYLLEPTGGSLKIVLNRKFDNFDHPKVQATLSLQRINLLIQPLQCHTVIFLLARIESAATAKMFLKGKPKERPLENPRAWWKYAIDSVTAPMRAQRAAISTEGCDSRRRRREEYVPIYTKLLQRPNALSTAEKASIERLEKTSTFEEIMFFRALSEIDAKTEAALAQKQKAEQPKEKGIGSLIGSFFWGSSPVASAAPAPVEAVPLTPTSKEEIWDSLKMTESERDAFYEVINFESPPQSLGSSPSDYVKFIVNWQNEAGQVTIFDENAQPLLAVGFHHFNAGIVVTPKTTSANITLQSLNANDLASKDSLFPRLLYPQLKEEESLLKFELLYRSNPQTSEGKAIEPDFEVSLALQKLNLVLNMDLARIVTSAFSKQLCALTNNSATPSDSSNSSNAQGSYWSPNSWAQSEKRNQQLLSLASMNKSVNLNIVVSAPNIIIPRACASEHSPVVIMALGTFKLQTDGSSTTSMDSLTRTHPIALTQQPELRKEYYTLHMLQISDIHAVVTSTDRCLGFTDLESFVEEEQLFSPISATVTIAACKIASESLAKLRISCFASPLHLRMSSTQLQIITRMLYYIVKEASTLLKSPAGSSEVETIRAVAIPRIQSTGWGGAVAFAETMVSASEEQKPSSFGTGLSLEVSSPDLRATLTLDSIKDSAPQTFDLALSSLGYAMETQETSMSMKIVLGALKLAAANPFVPSEPTLLLTSANDSALRPPTQFEDALIAIHLIHLKPRDSAYKNVDNECVFTFRHLSANLHNSLVRSLMIFIRTAIDLGERPQASTNNEKPSPLRTSSSSRNTLRTSESADLRASTSSEAGRIEFSLRFKCEVVQLALFDLDGIHLSEVSLKDSEATFFIPEAAGWRMSAVIGDFVILDSSPSTSSVSTAASKRRLLSLEKPNATKLELTSTPSTAKEGDTGFNPDVLRIALTLSSLHLKLNPKWLFNTLMSLDELLRAFMEVRPLKPTLPNSTSESAPASTTGSEDLSITILDINVSNSRIFMPEDLSASTYVVVDVGEAHITSSIDDITHSSGSPPNGFKPQLKLRETISIALSRADLFIGALESTGAHHSILGDSQVTLSIASTYRPGTTKPREDSAIWLTSESLRLILTAEHAHILFRALQHNLYYMPTDKELSRRLSQATLAEQVALVTNPRLYEFSDSSRPIVNSSFNVAFGVLRLELSDSLDINSSTIAKKRLLGLEARNLECQTRMLSDESLKVDFCVGQLSAQDLRDFSTLPHAHPLYNHPELDNEDNRLFVFPTSGMDPQLVGTFTTLPSRNQMTVCVTLRDFQLLPEATIVQRLLGVVNPITASLMAMLGRREAIQALTMAPKQKERYLRLKTHPDTSVTYTVTLIRPEILLASRSEFGLKFSTMSPASIDVSFSQAPTNSLTQITIKDLSASFGTTSETQRAKLFQISKPLSDSSDAGIAAPLAQVHHYDILSPLSLEATLLLTPDEHQYAVHFRNQVRICASYSDYIDVMELIGPFLAVDETAGEDGESSESAEPIFQLPEAPLGYDPTPIRYYPPASASSSTESLLSIAGSSNIGTGVATQQDVDKLRANAVEHLDMEEDDLYSRIMKAADTAEESWFQQQAASRSQNASNSAAPSSSAVSNSDSQPMLLNPGLQLPSASSELSGGVTPSAGTPVPSVLVSAAPSTLSGSTDSLSSAMSSYAPLIKVQRSVYVPKRLSIGSLRFELMVMDNQQTDLGLIRVKMDVVTLRLHNWDAEEYKKLISESEPLSISSSTLPDNRPLPMRTAQLEAKIEADCFAALVSAWEPLINPYRFEVIINGRDLRLIAASALNLVISENFILNFRRIVAVLEADGASQDLSNSQTYPRAADSAPNRMRSQHMHYINNCTGQHFQYEMVEETTQRRTTSRVLAPGVEEALAVPLEWATNASSNAAGPISKSDRAELAIHRVHFSLSIIIANHPLHHVNVNKVGCRVLTIDELRSVVVDVQYQQGVKVITLKSRVSLHNNTGVPLVVGLELGTVDVDRASQLPKAFNPLATLFSRKSIASPSGNLEDAPPSPATAFGSGISNGAVSQITAAGRVTTVSQICVIQPYSWYHIPIDIIHDGILRFRPGTTGEFVGFNSSQRAQQTDTDYSYQWGNYRCELRRMVAHRPRYVVCMPRPAADVLGVESSSSSAAMLNPFQYSTGVCRVATKTSIIAQSDEFVLHFQPPLVLENLLPSQAEYVIHEHDPVVNARKSRSSSKTKGADADTMLLPTVGRIEPGQRVALHNLSHARRILMGLMVEGFDWSPEQIIRFPEPNGPRYYAPGEEPPFGIPELPTSLDLPEAKRRGAHGPIETASRSTRIELENQMMQLGTRLVTFYAKYWIVNKTGLPLLAAADSRNPATIGADMLTHYNSNPSKAPTSPTKLDSTSSILGLTRSNSTDNSRKLPLSELFDRNFSSGCIDAPVPTTQPTSANPLLASRASTMFSPISKMQSKAPPTHRPMIYCPGGDADNERISVKVKGSKWSVPLPLESAASGLSRITVKGEDVALVDTGSTLKLGILGSNTKLRKFFDLSLCIGPAADRFWRTTVLSFAPRYMFTNKLSVPILFRYSTPSSNGSPSSSSGSPTITSTNNGNGVHTEGVLMPGETAPWHWIGASGSDRLTNEAIEMRLDLPTCSWSGPILLETRVMTTVAMFNPNDGSRIFVRLMPRMHTSTGITTIVFKQEELENPLFQIVNRTSQSIIVRQKGFASIPAGSSKHAPSPPYAAALDTVPALDSRIWGWYSPSTIEQGLEIAFVHGNRLPKTFSLTKVRKYPNARAQVGNMEFEVSLSVATDKTTRILVIEPATSLRRRNLASPTPSFDKRTTSSPSAGIQQRVQTRTQRSRDTTAGPSRSTTTLAESTEVGDFLDLSESESFDPAPSTPDVYDWKIGLAMQSISVSLINGEPEELLFGVVAHIGVELILYPKRWTLETQIGDLQVDNQDPKTFYPVAIASSGSKPRYWLQFSLIRSTEFPDIICQPLISLLIKETHVKVDEVLILKLLDLYTARRWRDVTQTKTNTSLSVSNSTALTASSSAIANSGSSPAAWLSGSPAAPDMPALSAFVPGKLLISNENVQMLGVDDDESKMVYTEFALLNPIHVLLSFQFTQRTTDDAREQMLREQRALKQSRYDPESWRGFGVPREFPALESFLRNPLTGIFTFERAPIFFSCLFVEHSFVSYNVLYDTVLNHYASQAVKFVMTVGGSLDVAGDPISLAYNLGSGVRDLFYEPAKGIAISPLAFGQGLGRGGAKFAKKSLYGIFNTINKGFHTLGTAAAFVSFDSDYRAKRAQRKQREQPKNVAYGVGQGAFEFSKGLFDGITGLVVQPIAGAQKEGAAGFFKGMGKGAAGLVVKPVVGALDLVQRTAEGIKNTASDFVQTQRCRWPLYIAEDGIVRTYSREPALAMRILHSIKNEEYAHELYCGYFRCTVTPGTKPEALIGTLLIASSQQLIFVSTTEKSASETQANRHMLIPPAQTPNIDVRWQIPLNVLKSTDYIIDQSSKTVGQFIFLRSDRRERHVIRLDGTMDRFQHLASWVKTLTQRHKLLSAFFKEALAEEDERNRSQN